MIYSEENVLLYDVDGVRFCPRCFRDGSQPHDDAVVFEITLSTLFCLSAVLDNTEFSCSECGKVVAETPSLRLENEMEECGIILENVPAQCPFCSSEEIIVEFKELKHEPTGTVTLGLRKWICLVCGTENRTETESAFKGLYSDD